MKKLIIPILLITAGLLSMGATKCDPAQPKSITESTYKWEVYAADSSCTCKESSDKGWQHVTTLLTVEYGFALGSGKFAVSTEHGEPTPFSRSGKGVERAIQATVSAQSADPKVKLLCIVYENGLALEPFAGIGSCNAMESLL